MATQNLIIGTANAGAVVKNSKRSQVNDGIVEHRTINGNTRIQYMFKKYVYEFECVSTVAVLESIIAELDSDPIAYVQYNKTGWNTIGSGVKCVVTIDDESYENFLQQSVYGTSSAIYVEYKLTCKEI